jgi:hypothetical protein
MGGDGFETHVFSGEEIIAKPPHVVFQVLTDVENALNAYSPTTLSVHPVTDTNFGVGAQWRLTRRELFLRPEQLFTVLECTVRMFASSKLASVFLSPRVLVSCVCSFLLRVVFASST